MEFMIKIFIIICSVAGVRAYCYSAELCWASDPSVAQAIRNQSTKGYLDFDEPGLRSFCSGWVGIQSCFLKALPSCYSTYKRLRYQGIHDTLQYICKEGFDDYLAHHDCFLHPNVSSRLTSCESAYNQNINNIGSDWPTATKQAALCRYTTEYHDCGDRYVEEECGTAAKDTNRRATDAMVRPMLQYFGCSSSGSKDGGTTPRPATDLFTCSFEDHEGFCGMARTWGSLFWMRNSGRTQSGWTGPSGAQSGSYYVYAEATGALPGQRARLRTPRLRYTGSVCLRYFYNMNGANMGSLRAYTQGRYGERHTISGTSVQGHQGDIWREIMVNISLNSKDIWIGFEATRGKGYRSDIAIDNIRISQGPCKGPLITPPQTSTAGFIPTKGYVYNTTSFISSSHGSSLPWRLTTRSFTTSTQSSHLPWMPTTGKSATSTQSSSLNWTTRKSTTSTQSSTRITTAFYWSKHHHQKVAYAKSTGLMVGIGLGVVACIITIAVLVAMATRWLCRRKTSVNADPVHHPVFNQRDPTGQMVNPIYMTKDGAVGYISPTGPGWDYPTGAANPASEVPAPPPYHPEESKSGCDPPGLPAYDSASDHTYAEAMPPPVTPPPSYRKH